MTVTVSAGKATEPRPISWAQVTPQLWVASAHGEFLGTVELDDGRYLAADWVGGSLGGFGGLAEARERVALAAGEEQDRRRSERTVADRGARPPRPRPARLLDRVVPRAASGGGIAHHIALLVAIALGVVTMGLAAVFGILEVV